MIFAFMIVIEFPDHDAMLSVFLGMQFLPLFLAEYLSYCQHHASLFFFEFSPALRGFVDLCKNFAFVGLVGGYIRMQQRFFFLQGGTEIDCFQAVLQAQLIELLLLVRGKPKLLCDVGIVPWFAWPESRLCHESKLRWRRAKGGCTKDGGAVVWRWWSYVHAILGKRGGHE